MSSLALTSQAQVPDWTEVSCESTPVEYNMHNLLSSGNAVILDFSAMWCVPCQVSAPELESVWLAYGSGSLNVQVFDFLIQDQTYAATTCAAVNAWEQNMGLTYPGFSDCEDVLTTYSNAYDNPSGGVPLILLFIPDENNPGQSQLVYNSLTGLGVNTSDLSDDLMALLQQNQFWALDIEEIAQEEEKTLVKITDLLGREVEETSNTTLIYVYSDGSTEKKFLTEL